MSTIRIFRSEIDPNKNMAIDDIETYLDSITEELTFNGQYIPLKLEQKLVLPSPDNYLNYESFNYVSIKNDDEPRTYYYFIAKVNWASQNSVEYLIVLDTINTYKDVLEFTDKTTIVREHLDRFLRADYEPVNPKYIRKIDRVDEGIAPALYKKTTTEIVDKKFNMDFYLLYRNNYDLSPTNIKNPLNCYLLAEEPLLIKKNPTPQTEVIMQGIELTYDYRYYLIPEDNPNYKFRDEIGTSVASLANQGSSVIWQFNVKRDTKEIINIYKLIYSIENGRYVFKSQATWWGNERFIRFDTAKFLRVSDRDLRDYYDIKSLNDKFYINAGISESQYTLSINEIDRADSKNVKLIKLPYSPTDLSLNSEGELVYDTDTWEYKDSLLKLKDLNSEFEHELTDAFEVADLINIDLPTRVSGELPNIKRSAKYESKLLHSAFYKRSLIYDTFELDIDLELYKGNKYQFYPSPSVFFKATNTVNSNFLFRINFQDTDFDSILNYPYILICKRNNEEVLFNSSYVDYIKNGYNYDKKTKERQQTMNWLTTGVQIAGAAAGFALGGFGAAAGVGLITSAVSSIAGNIQASMASEQAIKEKLQVAKNTAVGVQGNDDIDLMKYYSNNRAKVVDWECDEIIRDSIFDLFYYCGYKHPVQDLPKLDTRKYFNFIQCDPVFKKSSLLNIRDEFIKDIIARFNTGVTYYHHDKNNFYDFEQEYENWEVWL